MKKNGLLLLVAGLGLSLQSGAVNTVPKNEEFLNRTALEMLNLPSDNRRQIVAFDKDRYPQFIKIAFDDQQAMSIRWKALIAASDTQHAQAIKDIYRAAEAKEWFMRNAALVAAQNISQVEGEKVAQKLLTDKALVVRSAAVEVLEVSSSQDIRNTLWVELNKSYNFKKNTSLWIRPQIVRTLAKKPKDSELKDFIRLLDDKDLNVHPAAIAGLEKLTGVKLGQEKDDSKKLVGLWKEYLQN